MRALAALLTLALLAAGCGRRERTNPFDPANPGTGGRPSGFAALAGDGTVTLRWNAASAPELLGYQLERAVGADTGFTVVTGVLPPTTTSFRQFALLNGVDHRFRLYFVFQKGRGSLPAEDVATPGPLVPWVTDYGAGTLVQLTADGRRIAESLTLVAGGTPTGIGVDSPAGNVWVCDPTSGSVSVYRPQRQSFAVYRSGFETPGAVAVDSATHNAWIGDEGFDLVQHVTPLGSPAGPSIQPVDAPIGLALDRETGALWICERAGHRVRRVDPGGGGWATGVIAPSRVAVDSVTHDGWVSSFTRATVVVLSGGGARLDSVSGFDGPVGIAVDSRRGRVWVCDPNANQVIALRRNLTEEFRVSGLGGAREVAVDPATGEAWVTLALDGAVARLSPAGAVLRVVRGLVEPYAIALDVPGMRDQIIARSRPSGSPTGRPGSPE
jgi:DNA-binding beta-propeller fold protein YncE